MADGISFVLGSEVRRAVLAEIAEGSVCSRAVVGRCAASESAVYDALGKLADRGLVEETEEGSWRLTGAGRLVADTVERCEALDRVLGADPEYWASHDPTGLPERFRRSVDRLECCDVVRSPDTDPYRAARRVERAIRDADRVAIVAPVYSDRHAAALLESDAERRRLVMTPEMASRVVTDEPDGPEPEFGDLEIRIQSAAISLTLTDEELLFSVPTLAGDFDPGTEIASRAGAALEWGGRLFEHYWEQGTPVGDWLVSEHPDVASDHREALGRASPGTDDDASPTSGGPATTEDRPRDAEQPEG